MGGARNASGSSSIASPRSRRPPSCSGPVHGLVVIVGGAVRGDRRVIEEAVRRVVGAEQRLDPHPQPGIAAAGSVQVGGTGHRVGHLACGGEDVSFAHGQPPQPEGVSLPNAREASESRNEIGRFSSAAAFSPRRGGR